MTEKVLLKLRVGHESQLLDSPLSKQGALHTHRWTVFVRSAEGGPLDSRLLQKAVFALHPDFPNPNRVIKSPPFEVTETGYAGFSIPITLTFHGTIQQYNITYDMNLTMEKKGSYYVQQILEFRDPKRALREQLLRSGGYTPPSSGSKPKLSKKPSSTKPEPATPVFEKLFGPIVQPEKKKSSPEQKSTMMTPPRKVSRTEPRDASDKEEQGGKKSSKELSARSNGSHEATRRLQQGAPMISLSPTRSAPTTPHTRGGSSTHRRPTSSMSGDTPPPRQPDDSRPIDTQLLIQLAHDFGADERDAKALVARSEENALVAAATARVSSPIFTADSSPEQQPPSSPPPPDVYRKRKKSMSESTLPKRRAPAVANKGENSTAKAAPTERQLVEPAQLQRLLLLQKTLMTLSDASLLLRVARLVKEHTTVVAVNDGAALEFDLCLLKSPVIDRLVDMCSPSGGAVRSNGSA